MTGENYDFQAGKSNILICWPLARLDCAKGLVQEEKSEIDRMKASEKISRRYAEYSCSPLDFEHVQITLLALDEVEICHTHSDHSTEFFEREIVDKRILQEAVSKAPLRIEFAPFSRPVFFQCLESPESNMTTNHGSGKRQSAQSKKKKINYSAKLQ